MPPHTKTSLPPELRMGRGRARKGISEKEEIEVRQRDIQAIEMRLAGIDNQRIADALGFRHRSSVSKAIKREMDRRGAPQVDELRKVEVLRLERMIQALWGDVLAGKWLAVDRVLKCQERLAALLGLDAPQRRVVDVITHEGFNQYLDQLEGEVKQLREATEEDDVIDGGVIAIPERTSDAGTPEEQAEVPQQAALPR